jgi:SAM-dependent methyltransferase
MTTARTLLKQVRLLTAELQDVSFGEEDFLPDELEIANRTSRSLGAVGAKALVPRVVRDWLQPTDRVLDFGAGKDAAHAVRLKDEGFDVTAHEFGKNQQPGLHDPNALQAGPYDVVYASNVLNVQSNVKMLTRTLLQIRRALKPGGIFIGNFPKQPRKMGNDFSPADMAAKLSEVFGVDVMTVKPGGMPKTGRVAAEPVFFVRYKGYKGTVNQPSLQGAETMASTKTTNAVKAAVKAIESAKKLTASKPKKVKAGFMQPQVTKGDVLVVETDDGTAYIPAGEAKQLMVMTRNSSPEEVNVAVAEFLGLGEDEVSDVSMESNKYLARTSAPGYMDSTDWSMFDTEQEAWEYLIDMDASVFTWTVELTASDEEGGTAHIYMDSDAAAKAMVDAVQSVDGSKLERDGDFVYVGLTGNGEAVKDELDAMGFTTEEG